MSILYCTIPHLPIALERRKDPGLASRPLVLIDPEKRVFDVSAEAAACGIVCGMAARTAEIRCPEAQLLEADVAYYRAEREALLQLLERASSKVEPHGWGAAYVDLGDLARDHPGAIDLCQDMGQGVRRELGMALQPALGWDSSKFTAQAAAYRTPPGHLLAIAAVRERAFLRPLPVTMLPLPADVLQRLHFLGLRTLGQYAEIPAAAVWQQFGQAGKLAHRCARGEDDRPVVSRWQAPQLAAMVELEEALVEREWLMAQLHRLVSPLLTELQGNLLACGQVRLTVQFEDGSAQERTRTLLFPLAEEERATRILGQLLDSLHWQTAASTLSIALEDIQDATGKQLTLFPLEDESKEKLREVQRYLVTRFGSNRLRRAVLVQPGAPLPEWRVSWQAEGEL